jgi:RNA polymerase sigma-70 factor (ECF subfamily)
MTDSEVLEAIRNGNQRQLGRVYELYREEFLRWVLREYTTDPDDGKDIYQVSILALAENIRSGRLAQLTSSLKTYLFAIGKNLALDMARKKKNFIGLDAYEQLRTIAGEGDSSADDEAMLEAVRHAMERLGQPCRQLIESYYYGRRSMEEIAQEMLYKNPETAKNQKCKCMARLRGLVMEEFERTKINVTKGELY